MRIDSRSIRLAAVATAAGLALVGCSSDDGDEGTDEAGAPAVAFAAPTDGETVSSPVAIEMEATDLTVEAAGEVNEGAGHMHIMVDTDCVAEGEVIPNDDSHRHFGDGSTTTELELEAGEHTLCLQLADGEHVATSYTDTITITVE